MAKLKDKKKNPNSTYWRNKADAEVTKYYKGQPCIVCGTTHNTCGHHIVERSLSSYLRHDPLNIVPLCQTHHTMGNEIAPHSKNPLAVREFVQFLQEKRSASYLLLETYKLYRNVKVDYKQAYEEWKELNE